MVTSLSLRVLSFMAHNYGDQYDSAQSWPSWPITKVNTMLMPSPGLVHNDGDQYAAARSWPSWPIAMVTSMQLPSMLLPSTGLHGP